MLTFIHPSIHYPTIHPSIHPSIIQPLIHPYGHPSIHPSIIQSSIHPSSVHRSIYLPPIHPSIYNWSIHQSTVPSRYSFIIHWSILSFTYFPVWHTFLHPTVPISFKFLFIHPCIICIHASTPPCIYSSSIVAFIFLSDIHSSMLSCIYASVRWKRYFLTLKLFGDTHRKYPTTELWHVCIGRTKTLKEDKPCVGPSTAAGFPSLMKTTLCVPALTFRLSLSSCRFLR